MDLCNRRHRIRHSEREIWKPGDKVGSRPPQRPSTTGYGIIEEKREKDPKENHSNGQSQMKISAVRALKDVMAKGLDRILGPRVHDYRPVRSQPDPSDYKWAISATWHPQKPEPSNPAYIAAFTYYKDIPQSRRYDVPPLGWPSKHDMDPSEGLIHMLRHRSGASVWTRYMQFFEKECSKCGASFWPARCPACGSDQWVQSAWVVIHAEHLDLERLVNLELSTIRAAYMPIR